MSAEKISKLFFDFSQFPKIHHFDFLISPGAFDGGHFAVRRLLDLLQSVPLHCEGGLDLPPIGRFVIKLLPRLELGHRVLEGGARAQNVLVPLPAQLHHWRYGIPHFARHEADTCQQMAPHKSLTSPID